MNDIDENSQHENSAVKAKNSKRVKRQKCEKFQEKYIGVEMDDLLHEGCYSTKCSYCNRPTKLSTDASTQAHFVNIDESVNDIDCKIK